MPPAPAPRVPALLVIDLQNTLVDIAHRAAGTVGAVAGLCGRARAAGAPVVFLQQRDEELVPGTEGWRIAAELGPRDPDLVLPKSSPDGFLDTGLDRVLRERGVTEVVVTGFATEFCVDSTARRALALGYDLLLVSDGHTTSVRDEDTAAFAAAAASIRHHNAIFRTIRFPGRTSRVLPAAEVEFGTRRAHAGDRPRASAPPDA
ncbi:isochorismatase family cysteine hydrolase [Streptomyces sp. NPDC002490]|uniref:cysteine hydrolase family protein n=1 Tax=Streptomyces sp. NPDC002490 TaxID=3154416 RepID=UPI0033218B7B